MQERFGVGGDEDKFVRAGRTWSLPAPQTDRQTDSKRVCSNRQKYTEQRIKNYIDLLENV
jgi:hypothetical protein